MQFPICTLTTNPNCELKATAAIQSEKRILFLAASSPKGENPELWGLVSRNTHTAFLPEPALGLQHATSHTGQEWRSGRPLHAGGLRPGYLRGQRALPPGAGPGARRGGGAGPARLAGARRAPGGSVPFGRSTRIPARLPGRLPQENRAKGRLLPNNSTRHRRNNAGREPESREPGSAAPPAREPRTYLGTRVGEKRRSWEK